MKYAISFGALLAAALSLSLSAHHASAARSRRAPPAQTAQPRPLPAGTTQVRFENLEGLILVPARITSVSGRDTSGVLVLDTGAGYLALDRALAVWAGIADSIAATTAITMISRPLPRLAIEDLEVDQSSPTMTIDGEIVRAVTDRDILGLLGQKIISDRSVQIDFVRQRLALIPVAADSTPSVISRIRESRLAIGDLGPGERAVGFRLAGDGKILLRARILSSTGGESGPLTLMLDTGSTKCVLFQGALAHIPGQRSWRTARGLTAPTLLGTASARIALVPRMRLDARGGAIEIRDLDAAIIDSPLAAQLSSAVGENIDGLLGVSFLSRYRVTIDYPHRVLWLAPIPGWKTPRPFEYTHVGLQLERRDGQLRIAGLVAGSPAAMAGIRVGDELIAVDGHDVHGLDVSTVNRRLEGRAGTATAITTRRGDVVSRHRLIRRRLL